MKIGVCYIPTMPGTWEEAISNAGALGFEGFELTARHPAGRTDPAATEERRALRRIEAARHPSTIEELLDRPERVQQLSDAAERVGVAVNSLAVTGFGPGFRLSDADPVVREATVERVRLLIERAGELGASVLMVPVAPPLSDEPAVARWVESLRELLPAAEKRRVALGLETSYPPAKQRAIIESLASPWVGDYFDIGNFAAAGRDPVAEILERRETIVQLHVKGIGGAELSEGTVDLDAISRALGEIQFDRWMMLESSPGDDALGSSSRNLAEIRRHFGS